MFLQRAQWRGCNPVGKAHGNPRQHRVSQQSDGLAPSLSLPATAAVGKLSAPPLVEHAARLLRALGGEYVRGLHRHRQLSPPGESLSTWIDRWDYETRVLEVDGVFVAAPHTTP
jgi:hypothetical protein